jgi:vitamin B12 transporter
MKYKLLIVGALFGALSLPFAAYAETPMELLIVTPTRMPEPLDQTIADTTVLDEQDIRKAGAPDVPALLRSLAGVEVAQSGGLGSQSSVFMRGTNSNQVLVLLDGVRINSATTGATALEHIMLDNVQRIEVVRGNVSSLYGSEAIGGVIQIFTKQGQGSPAINASAGMGSHDTQRLAAGYSGNVNGTSFSVNAGKVRTGGVSAINPQIAPNANPNNNGYDNDSFDAQVKHATDAYHSLSASVFSTRGNSSYDSALGAPTDLNNLADDIEKFSLASDDQFGGMWHSTVRLAQGIDDSQTYTNGAQTWSAQTRSNQFSWQNNLKIAEGQRISFSVEHLGQTITAPTTPYTLTSRKVNSLMGGYIGEYGAQHVQLNLRQDRYSDFGTASTGLLGYGLTFGDNWRATASISSAFKAPTFNDMYYPVAWGGNPSLQPERSRDKEIGLHYAKNGQRVDAVYFVNRISNFIVLDAAYASINIPMARITGQELSYAGDFRNSHLKASATFQNPLNDTTGLILPRRAKEFGNITATYDMDRWSVGGEVRYSGVRQDTDQVTSGSVTLPSYTVLNLTARYRIDKNLDVSAQLQNLFDRDYSEVYGYNTLGRTLFVGLNYQQ